MKKLVLFLLFIVSFTISAQGDQKIDTLRYNTLIHHNQKKKVSVFLTIEPNFKDNSSTLKVFNSDPVELLKEFTVHYYFVVESDKSVKYQAIDSNNRTFIFHFTADNGKKGVKIEHALTQSVIYYANLENVVYIPKQI